VNIHTYDVNEKIKATEVRVVGSDNEQLGVMSTSRAIELAEADGLDLVQVNGGIVPPLCRIVDFGKFKYELSRKDKENKRRNRENAVEIKEIQLRPVTDVHDIGIKAKRTVGFLEDGDKVKVTVKFKGRELSHREMGQKILDEFCKAVGENNFKVETPMSMAGRQMMMVLTTNKK